MTRVFVPVGLVLAQGCRVGGVLYVDLTISPAEVELPATAWDAADLPIAEVTVTNAGPNPSFVLAAGFDGDHADLLVLTELPAKVALEPGASTVLEVGLLPVPQAWSDGAWEADLVIEGDAQVRSGGCGPSESGPAGVAETWFVPVRFALDCDLDDDGAKAAECGGGDCLDLDPQGGPGATDDCDGIDYDCDGSIDEDAEVWQWYADSDGDGFGDAEETAGGCDPPEGFVEDASDCDDDDSSVYPGAEEVCDGRDSDCDGALPDDEVDADADGAPQCADCDDSEPTIAPSAAESCDGRDSDCDGIVPEDEADLDSDGSPACADCDDSDSLVAPGADEACNGSDDDCDGSVPADESDGDGDGWLECEDCDDADADFHPGADESNCSVRVDYNCDGSTGWTDRDADGLRACQGDCDDGDATVGAATTWYADGDGDEYGAGETSEECYAPAGYVADTGDCDDADPAVSPGTAEVCGNGIDDDCSNDASGCGLWGEVDLGDDRLVGAILLGEATGDGAGYAVAAGGDLDGDGYPDLLVGAWGSDRPAGDGGAAFGVFTPVEGDVDLGSSDLVLEGESSGDYAGSAVDGDGDIDGDGYAEILVGAMHSDAGGSSSGAAYLVVGPASGEMSLGAADARLVGEDSDDWAGFAVAFGDLDGDSLDELIVGAYGTGSSDGTAYVVAGTTTGSVSLGDATASLGGATAARAVEAADLDGDGTADLIVGATYYDGGTGTEGAVLVLTGPISGEVDAADADGTAIGAAGDYAGWDVAAVDLDCDGDHDLAIGAPYVDDDGEMSGAAYGLATVPSGAVLIDSAATTTVGGDSARQEAGYSLDSARDADGDGCDDLLVGSFPQGGPAEETPGAAFLLLGPLSGSYSVTDADGSARGEAEDDWAGYSVAGVGDTDGDGSGEMLVGAWGSDRSALSAGAAYLLMGGTP